MSKLRSEAAEATRTEVLHAARTLFARNGIDRVTIEQVARKAGVSVSTVYSLFRSKEGILRGILETALFGSRYREAVAKLEGVSDPVRRIALTATVARAIYEGESAELSLLRGAAAFSPALRKMEQEFERIRLEMQRQRVEALFAAGRQAHGLNLDEARRVLWMYTSRDVYRMLVQESGWTADRYETWLSETLVTALIRA